MKTREFGVHYNDIKDVHVSISETFNGLEKFTEFIVEEIRDILAKEEHTIAPLVKINSIDEITPLSCYSVYTRIYTLNA